MTQNSLLDTLLSLFGSLQHTALLSMIPNLLFRLVGLWLSVVGWKRQRASGFLLLLASSVIGVVSALMYIWVFCGDANFTSERAPLASIASHLGTIAAIFGTAGIWHFVYRARFAPPEPTPQ